MEEFRDPSGIGKAAVIALIVWLGAALLYGGAAIHMILAIGADQAGNPHAWASLETADQVSAISGAIYLLAYLACAIIIGRWIYRVNKNAWQISDHMTVSPGWNIGFFFIPILNLFRPFRGIRETWQASHAPHDPDGEPVPGMMRLWWGAWLISAALGHLSFRLGLRAQTLDDFLEIAYIDLVGTAVDLVAGLTLLWIIRRLTDVQSHLRDYEVFE